MIKYNKVKQKNTLEKHYYNNASLYMFNYSVTQRKFIFFAKPSKFTKLTLDTPRYFLWDLCPA